MIGYRFLPPAEEEMTEASLFYEAASSGLGEDFLDDVQRAPRRSDDRRAPGPFIPPDSLGLYITYAPCVGRTDAERNCISNIHSRGLGYEEAAKRLDWLVSAALARGVTGIALKDESSVTGDDPGVGLPKRS